MFKINGEEKKTKMSRSESARRRQLVYAEILGNPDRKLTAKQLAIVAGFDVTQGIDSKEYRHGMAFIDNMQRSGYIGHDIPTMKDGNLWYVHGKEKVDCEHLLRDTHPTEEGIEDRAVARTLTVKKNIEVQAEPTESEQVPVGFPKVVHLSPKKFDIVFSIYEHGSEDPNNASLEIEGRTAQEIADAIMALASIL